MQEQVKFVYVRSKTVRVGYRRWYPTINVIHKKDARRENGKGNRSKLGHAWSREFTAYWLVFSLEHRPYTTTDHLSLPYVFRVRFQDPWPICLPVASFFKVETQRRVVSRWSTLVIARNHGNACLFGGSFGHRGEGARRVKGYAFSRPLNAKKGCKGSAGSQGRIHWLRETRPPLCSRFFFFPTLRYVLEILHHERWTNNIDDILDLF